MLRFQYIFLLTLLSVITTTSDYDDIDNAPREHSGSKNESRNTHMRRSILRRLLDYAQDGTNPVSGEKGDDAAYFEELYKICGKNATCISEVIYRAAQSTKSETVKKQLQYDRLVLQIVEDVKDWLKVHETPEETSKNSKKRRKLKKVRFHPHVSGEHSLEEYESTEMYPHTGQRTLWLLGSLFTGLVFCVRKMIRQRPDTQFGGMTSPFDDYSIVKRLRKYLLV